MPTPPPVAPPPAPTQYHVTLCKSMRIKLEGHSTWFIAFDAVLVDAEVPVYPMAAFAFRTNRLYLGMSDDEEPRVSVMVTTLIVPIHNLAGMVPQPFKDR